MLPLRHAILAFLSGCAVAGVCRAQTYVGTPQFRVSAVPNMVSPFFVDIADGRVVGRGSVGTLGNFRSHAFACVGPTGTVSDLHPTALANVTHSYMNGTSGTKDVGSVEIAVAAGSRLHAVMWSGTAASAIDLNPSTFLTNSWANGTNGSQQVGAGYLNTSAQTHAVLWNGTAASARDIHPTNLPAFEQSEATATDGVHQVGHAIDLNATRSDTHAILWSGTGASAVDLNPSEAVFGGQTGIRSYALGVGGDQQVGYGNTFSNLNPVPLLWTGTAESAINLRPTGLGSITESMALATNGVNQVGYASIYLGPNNFPDHAVLWSGTAASAIDLQLLLPTSGTWSSSSAMRIDTAGNVYGLATGRYNGVSGTYAVKWSPVPEPTASAALVASGFVLLLRRRRFNGTGWRPYSIA